MIVLSGDDILLGDCDTVSRVGDQGEDEDVIWTNDHVMQLCRDVFRCYYSPFQEHTLLANCLRLELDETDDTNTTYIGAILKLGVPLIFWATFFLNPSLKFQFKLPVCFWFNITFKGTDCINGTLFERSLMPRKVNYTRILQIFSSKEGYENRYVIITYIQVIITTHNSKKKMF